MLGSKIGEKWLDLKGTVVISLSRSGNKFEVFVDPELAWDFRRGKNIPIEDILNGYEIFENAKRGEKASEEVMKNIFGTDDVFEVAKEIILKGEFKLTHDQRKKMIQEKRQKIIDVLSKTAINPQTGYPHPPARLDKALDEAKVSIDPFLPVEEQLPKIIKALRPIIPLSTETVKLKIVIPAAYTGKSYSIIAENSTIMQEKWNSDGSWEGIVELPIASKQKLHDELAKLTKGQVDVQVI